jgi:hypothetical protein
MFPSRFINILICFCLLSYTLLPQALVPCCCSSQSHPDKPSKPASCCVVEPVKADCCGRLKMMENGSCPSKSMFGSTCPFCLCLQSLQVEVVAGPGIHQALNRASIVALHSPLPRPTIRTAAFSDLGFLARDRGGTDTLLRICVLTC